MCLAWKSGAVTCPIVEDPEAVARIDLAELDFDGVVRVGLGVECEQIQQTRTGLALLPVDDANVAQAQPGWVLREPILQPPFVIPECSQRRRLAREHGSSPTY